MKCPVMVVLFTFIVAVPVVEGAVAATLAPTDDAFGYQSLNSTSFSGSAPLNQFLPAGQTTTGHSTKSAVKFDVASLGVTAAEVTSATLSLLVISTEATGFGVSPDAANPVTVNLSALGPGAWAEATATWDSIPASVGLYDSQVVNATNVVVTFDVTALVQDWLNGSVANNGLLLEGALPVGALPTWYIPTFSSKEGTYVPTLTVVPEPASGLLALVAVPALFWLGRGRLRAKKN